MSLDPIFRLRNLEARVNGWLEPWATFGWERRNGARRKWLTLWLPHPMFPRLTVRLPWWSSKP